MAREPSLGMPTWQEAVLTSNAARGRLILTFVNSGFLPFLRNWLGGLRALGLTEFVVVALDLAAWRLMAHLGLQSHAVHLGSTLANSTERASSWYDSGYKRLMGSQPARVKALFGSGRLDVLVTDADVVWLRSPWPALYAPARAHCDVQGMAASSRAAHDAHRGNVDAAIRVREPHPQANCASCINAGFLFLRGGVPSVVELLRRWDLSLRAVKRIDHNQKHLNWILATGGVPAGSAAARAHAAAFKRNGSSPLRWEGAPTVCQLDGRAFANGETIRDAGISLQSPQCACEAREATRCEARRRLLTRHLHAVHLNYALSPTHKTCMAKSVGAWLLSDDPRHWAAYARNRTERIGATRAAERTENGHAAAKHAAHDRVARTAAAPLASIRAWLLRGTSAGGSADGAGGTDSVRRTDFGASEGLVTPPRPG